MAVHPRSVGRGRQSGSRPIQTPKPGRMRVQTSVLQRREPTRMARLAGVDLPRDKRLEVALTYIYGVGPTRAKQTLEATGLSPDLRARDLSDEDIVKLREHI